MNLKTTKENIKKSEKVIGFFSALVMLALFGIFLYQQVFHAAFMIGYLAGIFCFFALSLTFSRLDKMPAWFRMIAILSSSFKVLFLLLLAMILKLLGFSIVEVVYGLLTSQLVIIAALVIIVYSTRKTVEIVKGKEKKHA